MTRLDFKGCWSKGKGTAVGSKTFGRYHSNPCVLFRLRKPGKVTFRLISTSGNKNLAVNVSLYRCVGPSTKTSRHARVRRRHTEPTLEDGSEDVLLHTKTSAEMLRSSLVSKKMSQLFDSVEGDDNIMSDKMRSRVHELLNDRHSEKDSAFTLSYVRLRDVLVDEFGQEAFEKAKTSIQMAMQGRSRIVTGEVVATSCNGMYSTNSSGVAVSNVKVEMSFPYIAIVSTFEPSEGQFRLIMYTETCCNPDVIQHEGMERERER